MAIIDDILAMADSKGVRRGDLARRSGLSPSGLSRITHGTHGARLDTAERMANVLGMRLALVPDDDFAARVLSGTLIDFGEDG